VRFGSALFLILSCGSPQHSIESAIARGSRWLASQPARTASLAALRAWAIGGADPETPDAHDFPTYANSLAILAGHATAARAEQLRSSQLVEGRGFHPDQVQYGGWDLGAPNDPGRWVRSDLSVTTFALEALASIGERRESARVYVERCIDAESGGFFFCPWASKAGYRGDRPRPYGSMTADGIRALLAIGAPATDPRVVAALHWLSRHYTLERNPGFEEALGEDRVYAQATLFYYYQALARTMAKVGRRGWQEGLAAAVVSRQRQDGSWANAYGNEYSREQEPFIATCFALVALKACLK
jgi:squalene-hopene/tetraprenyl-beta-curcumene cyclase